MFSNEISTVQKIVLSSSRGQGNFRGLEASWPRPRPRTSKCVLEAKDVFEDSTSDFWHPHLRGTRLWHSQILSNFIFIYLPVLKNFFSPGWVVRFWILAALFEGDPFILVPPNLVKFHLIFILSILKISSIQRKWLNFEFWHPCL